MKISESKLYNYFHDGQDKSSFVENVVKGMVFLENGEKYTVQEFSKLVGEDEDDAPIDEDQFLKEAANESPISTGDIPNIPLKLDANGMPILLTSEDAQDEEYVGIPNNSIKLLPDEKPVNISSALKQLLDGAEKQEIQLSITIPIKVIDKALFGILRTSFKGTDYDIIKYMSSTADMKEIRSIIELEIGKHLGKEQ